MLLPRAQEITRLVGESLIEFDLLQGFVVEVIVSSAQWQHGTQK